MRKSVLLAGVLCAGLIMAGGKASAHAQGAQAPKTTKPTKVVVEVKPGDSLSKIAKKQKTTYQRIFYANDFIQDPNVIHPGDKVRIPDSKEKLKERALPETTVKTAPVAKKTSKKAQTSYKSYKKNGRSVAVPKNAVSGSVWDRLAACESGGNWAINTGNGYYGGLQFSAATWRGVGGSGLPHQASKAEQIKRGQILQARSGWGQWPACTRMLGLR
jgi:LysM repeat protein